MLERPGRTHLGFLMANLGVWNWLATLTEVALTPGISVLDLTLSKKEKYHLRWRLLVNSKI